MKVSNEITTILSDYTTNDNIHLTRGQHVQIVNRNNDQLTVQLLNNFDGSSSSSSSSSAKQCIEVQIPISLVKCRVKSVNDGKSVRT